MSPVVTVTSSFTPQRRGTLFGISLRGDRVTEAYFPSPSEAGHGVKSDPQLVTRIERTLFGTSARHVLSPTPTRSLLIHFFPVRCPNSYSSQKPQPYPRLSSRFNIVPPVKCDRQARLSDMMPPTRWEIQRLSGLDINYHRVRRIRKRSGSFGV